MTSEEYKNGFRQAVLCVDSFWDNIDLYYDNPILRRLDPTTQRELKYALGSWMNRYLDKVVKDQNESRLL